MLRPVCSLGGNWHRCPQPPRYHAKKGRVGMKDRISAQERAVRRLVEAHGIHPSRYGLAGRHHDAGSYVPDLCGVRDDDPTPTGKPCQTAFASSNTRLPLEPGASRCGFRMVAQASSFIGMTFRTAGLGRGCWIVKLRGRKRRHLQRPRGAVPKLARRTRFRTTYACARCSARVKAGAFLCGGRLGLGCEVSYRYV